MLKIGTYLLILVWSLPILAENNLASCFLNGLERPVFCGQIEVPLNEGAPDAHPPLALHFAVIKAISSPASKDPLFILSGGPGQAATEIAFLSETAFKRINIHRDIVLIDQRGTGRSHAMKCLVQSNPDTDQIGSLLLRDCFEQLPFPAEYFTTDSVVKDMERVRDKLNYKTINLWGGSFGTRSAQLYAFTYPERVRSIILDAPLAINSNALVQGGVYAIKALKRLIEDCQNDSLCHHYYPKLDEQLDTLFKSDQTHGNLEALFYIRTALYRPELRSLIPFAISELSKGNRKPILRLAKLFSVEDVMYLGATLSILCLEDVYPQAEISAANLQDTDFIGERYYKFWQAACGNKHATQQPAYLNPKRTLSIPTLILSGSQDPITPPASGRKVQAFLPNSQLVAMKHRGHIISNADCIPDLMAEFMQTLEKVNTDCIEQHRQIPFNIPPLQLTHQEQLP